MFPSCSGQKGILLADAVNEDVHDLVGGDEPVFASYTCPAVSLRILVRSNLVYLKNMFLSRSIPSGQVMHFGSRLLRSGTGEVGKSG